MDRVFVNGYIPGLQSEGQLMRFFLDRGFTITSPAILGRIHERLISDIDAFIAANGLEVVRCKRGESKEDAPYPIWCWVNDHEWLKRQLAARDVGFCELDNGSLPVTTRLSPPRRGSA